MHVSADFDGGSIGHVYPNGVDALSLTLRRDNAADIRQWFYFRLVADKGRQVSLRFEDAAASTYPEGWVDYNIVVSNDNDHWHRVATIYENGVLSTRFIPASDVTYCAYFEPYSVNRHLRFLGRIARSARVTVSVIGTSVEGRDLDLITIGRKESPKKIWVIARQHPGETMGQWLVQGLISRLLRKDDSEVDDLLSEACIHCIPNINPDGAARGNLRTNAAGVNLNRAWDEASESHAPEVHAIRKKIYETGVHAFLDVHGTERMPYVFVESADRLPSYSSKQRRLQSAFVHALDEVNSDFQTDFGYPSNHATKTDLSVASKHISSKYDCLSLTLEMPFKDNALRPMPHVGWNGRRARNLGADIVHALNEAIRGF